MTFADDLLTTLATPAPRHVITSTRVEGYLCTVCACGSGIEVKGWDESSISASNYWALEHANEANK